MRAVAVGWVIGTTAREEFGRAPLTAEVHHTLNAGAGDLDAADCLPDVLVEPLLVDGAVDAIHMRLEGSALRLGAVEEVLKGFDALEAGDVERARPFAGG